MGVVVLAVGFVVKLLTVGLIVFALVVVWYSKLYVWFLLVVVWETKVEAVMEAVAAAYDEVIHL